MIYQQVIPADTDTKIMMAGRLCDLYNTINGK